MKALCCRSVGLDLDRRIIPLRVRPCSKVIYTSGIKFLFPACTTTLNRLQSLGPSPAYDHDWKLEILGQRLAFSRNASYLTPPSADKNHNLQGAISLSNSTIFVTNLFSCLDKKRVHLQHLKRKIAKDLLQDLKRQHVVYVPSFLLFHLCLP